MRKLLLAAMLLLVATACTTTQYVPVIEHKTDTLIQTKVQKDSIWLHDSIHITEKGDTVRIEKWHTKYVEKQVHDTTYISKIDSVPAPYPVVKEVEKKLSKRHVFVFVVGMMTIIGIVIVCAWWIIKLLRKFGIIKL